MTQIHEYSSLFTAGLAMTTKVGTTSAASPPSRIEVNQIEVQSANLAERRLGKILSPLVVNSQPVKAPPARCRRRSSVTLLLSPITEQLSTARALQGAVQASMDSGVSSAPFYTQRFKTGPAAHNSEQLASMLGYGKMLKANGYVTLPCAKNDDAYRRGSNRTPARRKFASKGKAKPPPTSPLPAIPDTPSLESTKTHGSRQPLATIQA